MAIQWYPGHMHKAQKEMRKVLPSIDLLIEVLDGRIPFSSENPMISEIRRDKPCIKVFSKSDLADSDLLNLWKEYYEQEKNTKTLPISIKEQHKYKSILDLCVKLLPEKAASVKKIRTMIVGIPNVGKSTLINHLAGRSIAKTGDEPAVTKAQQEIHLNDDIVLLDTPGILWPKQEYEKSSYRLAVTGAIKDTAMSYDDVAFFAAEFLLKQYPDRLKGRYKLEQLPETELEFFETIGRARGCLGRGGYVDLNKISEQFVNDIRSGQLGSLCFETPDMVQGEIIEAQQKLLEKEQKKKSRKNNFKQSRR